MPAERTEEHARGGPRPPRAANSATRPPTSAATAAGRELMAGTRSTRNTSGTAKSRGSDSGTATPMSTPMIVQICQLTQSNSGRAEVVGHLVVEPGGGRPAGGRVVGLLRPPGDRHGVGLVGQQVAHEQPPSQRHRGEVRGERRRVEEQAQVDGARGDHRDQRRRLRRPARRPPRAGTRPRTRWSTARSTRPRRARSWRALRPPPGRTGSPRRASVPPPWPPPAARRGRSGSAPEHHAVTSSRSPPGLAAVRLPSLLPISALPRRRAGEARCCAGGCTWSASSWPSRRG